MGVAGSPATPSRIASIRRAMVLLYSSALRKLSGKSIQILALGPMGEQIVQGLPAAKVVAPGWVNDDAVVAKAYRPAR